MMLWDDFEPIHNGDEPRTIIKPSVFEWMPSKYKRDSRKKDGNGIYPSSHRQHHCTEEPSQLETIEMVWYEEYSLTSEHCIASHRQHRANYIERMIIAMVTVLMCEWLNENEWKLVRILKKKFNIFISNFVAFLM